MGALWNDWDPIGVCPSENSFQMHIVLHRHSLQLLKQAPTIAEIKNYLMLVIEEHMGFDNVHTCIACHIGLQKSSKDGSLRN